MLLIWFGNPAVADDRLVRLFAPPPLVESGLIKHIVPRFSLKTQVRVQLVETADQADMRLGSDGVPVFAGPDQIWHMMVANNGHSGTDRFATWLTSEIGLRTITGFAPDGAPVYIPPPVAQTVVETQTFDGDAEIGRLASIAKCGRCHVVDPGNRHGGIGSTPSFFVLRTLGDWDIRFQTFYALNPHPSFTQVKDVTAPFAEDLPPAIVPVEMTLDDLEAIVAYVASLEAANLGAPLQHQ